MVSGFSLDELLNGGPLVKRSVAEVFELMDILALRSDGFRLDNVSELRYDPDIGVTMFMKNGGLEVMVGFGPFGEKMRRLGRVTAALEEGGLAEGLIYLNLECVPRVTARYLPGMSPADRARDAVEEEPLRAREAGA